MRAIEAAEKQALFREVNERVRDLNNSVEHVRGGADFGECFTCECARQDCGEHVKMGLGAYEELRRVPAHFAVAPQMAHVFQDVERLVQTHHGYFVVEKLGEPVLAASKLDPCSSTRGARGSSCRSVRARFGV